MTNVMGDRDIYQMWNIFFARYPKTIHEIYLEKIMATFTVTKSLEQSEFTDRSFRILPKP